MKIKIGMEFRDFGFSGLDFRNIEAGNPGCGGTQYEFALLAHHLLKSGLDCEITFFHYSKNYFSDQIKEIIVRTPNEILEQTKINSIDVLVFWATHDSEWYAKIDEFGIRSIAWCHNFLDYNQIKLLKQTKKIKKIVLVSKEQYELMCGEDVFDKCCYIPNMIDFPSTKIDRCQALKNNIVCIVGSIMKEKGFHLLTKNWKRILKRVPDAKLYVIGTGNLYDSKMKLGQYGLAESSYEKTFIKHITDNNGNMLDSVVFFGNLGQDKELYLKAAKVGVVNPTGIETCCISALEFEAYGVPVCTKGKNGLLNTVAHKKTGLLSSNNYVLFKNIVHLLKHNDKNIAYSNNCVAFVKQFNGDFIVKYWIELLTKGTVTNDLSINYRTRLKWLRCTIHRLRKIIVFKWIPTPSAITYANNKFKGFLARIKNSLFKK